MWSIAVSYKTPLDYHTLDSLKCNDAEPACLEKSEIVTDSGLIPKPNLFCGIETIDAVGYKCLSP